MIITKLAKKDYIDVEDMDVIEEVHTRIDALIKALDKKGVLSEQEYLSELHKLYEKKEED